jgi:L-threonylcarbamoyladenylate synthase
LDRAAAILRAGGLVAVPTETVYGLCGNGLDASAVERIYEVKGRPDMKPLPLMVPGADVIGAYCEHVPKSAGALVSRFWPGPLSLVLPSKPIVPDIVRAGGSTVALRCPDHPLTLSLLRTCGLPLAGPSANPSGAPSPRSAQEVLTYFDGKIDAVLDGGECAIGRESTIVDLSRTPYHILRRGAVPEEEIVSALVRGLFLIGLTGPSGAGKTTALEVLSKMGALVLDADEVYHKLTGESAALRDELCARFGPVYSENILDRKKLGAIVFADVAALRDLNAISHRFVDEKINHALRDHALGGGELAAVDAVALLESGLAKRCSVTVGVLAPREERIRRIVKREGISEEYARLRIEAQKPDEYYKENCDVILCNDGTQEAFRALCGRRFSELIGGYKHGQ